ncbi:MAG: hypothetical protein LBC97_03540 [Bifidobacteriaceae bacterium]|jgi:hypothetical protein|nr:hypothetical protein [Bifidobacteriaceae bacterium]
MLSSVHADEVVGAIIGAMRREAYAELSINLASRCLARLAESCEAAGGRYTTRVGALFAKDTANPKTGLPSDQRRKLRGRLARLADSYLEAGAVDLAAERRPGPQPATLASRQILSDWEAWTRAEGWSGESVSQHVSYARRFLLWLEDGPEPDVDGADPAAAEEFLTALRATCAPSSMRTVKNVLAGFCRFAGRGDLADGFAQARTEHKRSPLPVLTNQETSAVGEACRRAVPRDAAIVLLALTTGLRAVDICALELGSVDWRAARIAYPVISAVLGHADPASVDAYLETDTETMRGCVLPLPEAARL